MMKLLGSALLVSGLVTLSAPVSAQRKTTAGSVPARYEIGGGSAARFEGFLSYMFPGGGQASNVAIGTRIGLSFWH